MSEKDEVLLRLRRIEGQVGGICRMYEDGRTCLEIFDQLAAARSGLEAAAMLILERHVADCLSAAAAGEEGHAQELEIVTAVRRLVRRT
jgi:CsoR family transcriptional regulator, copper-sensing transcriptional repressor